MISDISCQNSNSLQPKSALAQRPEAQQLLSAKWQILMYTLPQQIQIILKQKFKCMSSRCQTEPATWVTGPDFLRQAYWSIKTLWIHYDPSIFFLCTHYDMLPNHKL